MSTNIGSIRGWLTAIVAAHLVLSFWHGTAHDGAHVPLSLPMALFVYIVIVAGPPAGLALTWRSPRTGYWLVAVTMAGSLVFGLLNHFVLGGPDHVAHVTAGWRPLFSATAVLLALSETAGLVVAVQAAQQRARMHAS
jgi:hypothetical protein